MLKVKVRWSGFIGSPGWSNFYFDGPDGTFTTAEDATTVANKVDTFITALQPILPPIVNLHIQSDVEVVSQATGDLISVVSIPARTPKAGTSNAAAGFSGVSGAVITWRTAGVRNGRRVRGRTFLVPLANVFEPDGTLAAANITTISNAANGLLAPAGALTLGVFARPTGPGLEDGDFYPVTSASVPDMAAVLRSRRG